MEKNRSAVQLRLDVLELIFLKHPRRFWQCLYTSRSGELSFSETLVPYNWDTSWIDGKLAEMIATLNSEDLPDSNPSCENCAYARQRNLKEVLH